MLPASYIRILIFSYPANTGLWKYVAPQQKLILSFFLSTLPLLLAKLNMFSYIYISSWSYESSANFLMSSLIFFI